MMEFLVSHFPFLCTQKKFVPLPFDVRFRLECDRWLQLRWRTLSARRCAQSNIMDSVIQGHFADFFFFSAPSSSREGRRRERIATSVELSHKTDFLGHLCESLANNNNKILYWCAAVKIIAAWHHIGRLRFQFGLGLYRFGGRCLHDIDEGRKRAKKLEQQKMKYHT